jgi:hypothetical protein
VSLATPARVLREARRATLARALAALFVAHDVTDRAVAALTGAAHQHVAQWRDPDAPKSLGFADALALPLPIRRALAEMLMPGHVVAALPDATPRASIAHAIEVQRETSDVVTLHMLAIADGVVSRGEASKLRPEIREAMRALVALDHVCEQAMREGAVSAEEVH